MTSRLSLTALGAAVALAFAPLAAPAATVAAPHVKAVHGQQAQFDRLADAYYDSVARFEPIGATEAGDGRFNDRLPTSIWPQARARHFAELRQFQQRLHKIDRGALTHQGQVSYDILGDEIGRELALARFPEHLLPISQMDSVPIMMANYAGGQAGQPFRTPKEYRDYLARLNQLPAWLDQASADMREGMQRGVVQPRALIVALLPQIQKLVTATPEENTYYLPIKHLPASFSEAGKAALTRDYRAAVAKLLPSLAHFSVFLEKTYLPATRETAGLGALPQGAAWYQALIARHTTTSLNAEQIHEIGLREVARIQDEYAKLGPRLGYTGPAAGLPNWVFKQPQTYPFKSADEVMATYRKVDAKLRTILPKVFKLAPKSPLDIRFEPELSRATASDHYTPPAADGSRPGVFWVVVNDPKEYPVTEVTTLFLHEGQPGHHYQLALQQEIGLPNFRKFGGNNAFAEGWALYAETLGKEMGLYADDPAAYFGHLNDQLLRDVRLVVDTGMHAKGWTREQSIKYMEDTLGYSPADATNATERYMAWPGQALSYKIGALKIEELRQRAAAALGAKFDLGAFHEVVLSDGALPLSVLEAKVDRWIAATK